jgi:hypothetical protein
VTVVRSAALLATAPTEQPAPARRTPHRAAGLAAACSVLLLVAAASIAFGAKSLSLGEV